MYSKRGLERLLCTALIVVFAVILVLDISLLMEEGSVTGSAVGDEGGSGPPSDPTIQGVCDGMGEGEECEESEDECWEFNEGCLWCDGSSCQYGGYCGDGNQNGDEACDQYDSICTPGFESDCQYCNGDTCQEETVYWGCSAEESATEAAVIDTSRTLTKNLMNSSGGTICNGHGIRIDGSGIVLDCAGYSITGPGTSTGIETDFSGITIKNCVISNFNVGMGTVQSNSILINNDLINNVRGIEAIGALNTEFSNITLINNTNEGLYIYNVRNSTFSNITSTGSNYGVYFRTGRDNTIENSTISGNSLYQIYASSANLTLKNQQIYGNYSFTNATLTFEDTNEAEIEYLEPITGNGSNLSGTVRMGSNLVDVDTVSEPEFSKNANITIYNTTSLGFSDRVPYRNGAQCPPSICTELIDNDTYVFNVTGFTNYSVGEDVPDLTPPSLSVVSNPSPVANGSSANLTINITEENPDKYVVYENGNIVNTASYSNGIPFGVVINTSVPGTVNYTIWANDTAGNYSSVNASVTVLIAPTVQLISPANSQTLLSEDAELKFYSSSVYNSSLGYNLTINGAVNQTGTAVSGANTTISLQLANGSYSWNATVWDYPSTAKTSSTNSFNVLTDVSVDTVTVSPIVNTTNSSGLIDLASEGVPDSVINQTGITGYEYVVTTNGSTPSVKLNVSIFLEPSEAGTSDISGTDGAVSGFYYQIAVNDSSWYDNVTTVQLKIYYNISNIEIPSEYSEASLRHVRYTSGSWVRLDCTALGGCTAALGDGTELYAAGADTTNKYVWANLSRFSTYGIGGGSTPSAATSGGGGRTCYDACSMGETVCKDGSMYVCGNFDSDSCTEWDVKYCDKGYECEGGKCVKMPCVEDWVCGEWSDCANRIQERECEDWNSCGTISRMPELSRACIEEEKEIVEEMPAPVVEPVLPAGDRVPMLIARIKSYIVGGYEKTAESALTLANAISKRMAKGYAATVEGAKTLAGLAKANTRIIRGFIFTIAILFGITLLIRKPMFKISVARKLEKGVPQSKLVKHMMKKGYSKSDAKDVLLDIKLKKTMKINKSMLK